jgi:hypothetical protein
MVFSTTWLEFKDMAQDPLVRREPVSASCNRRPDEGLETQKYSLLFLTVLVDKRLLGSQCCLSTGLVANDNRRTKRCNALSSRSDVTRGLPDLGKSFTLLVCVCFLTSPVLKQHWLPNRRLSTRTVRNRLKSAGLKRPLLVDRHRRTRLAWCLARRRSLWR